MFTIIATVLFLKSVVHAAPLTNDTSPGPIVDLGFGKYAGLTNTEANANLWYSIPYAIPPTGSLRWHAPQPIDSRDPWGSDNAVTDASKPGPPCVQGTPAWQWTNFNRTPEARGSEDCLTVNIMAPASWKPGDEKLPVLMKIHGGGYTQGQAHLDDGYSLLRHSRGGLVFVSMQYRLGVYGFLASEAVKAEGVANAGLLDQRLAMSWVSKYIDQFGGDPKRVVVQGGNSGGGSIGLHLMMFGGRRAPDFDGAIIDWPLYQSFHGPETLEAQYRHLLHSAGCANLTCLRELPDKDLATAAQETYTHGYFARPKPFYGYGDYYFGPVVDGKTIQGIPSDEFGKGRFTPVPVLVTRDKYEGYLNSNASIKTEDELARDIQRVFPQGSDDFVRQVLDAYPAKDYQSTFDRREAMIGDLYTNCPTAWILNASQKKSKGTWKMQFNAGSEIQGAAAEYVYDPGFERSNKQLAGYMKDWMISFARNLDPNRESWLGLPPGTKPTWPIYGEETDILQVDDDTVDATTDTDVNQKCDFWRSQSDITRI